MKCLIPSENASARSRLEIGKTRVLAFSLVLALAFLGVVTRGGQLVRPLTGRKLSKSCRMTADAQQGESDSQSQAPDAVLSSATGSTGGGCLIAAQEPALEANPSVAVQALRAPPLRV